MIIYCAGKPCPPIERRLVDSGLRHRLLSFVDIAGREKAPTFWTETDRPMDARVFLDCGAFSVNSRGVGISFDRYCEYLASRNHAFETYAAFDVIGDWRQTARNVRVMRARGLDPLPVFHRGSAWRELERFAAEHGRVALGGFVTLDRQAFLDLAFRRLERFWPVRVHGFGLMAPWALRRYPFYSVDSSSAILSGGMGRVLRFNYGRMSSQHWVDDVQVAGDLSVADGLGPDLAGNGSAHVARKCRSVSAVVALEQHVTALWRRRGVTWD